MITKAIIEDIVSDYQVKVRIPIFDSSDGFSQATSTTELNNAIICTLPKCSFNPSIGDIVLVGFEDFDPGKPIILGCLFKESGNTSVMDLEVGCLTANSIVKLSENTTIGTITYKDLQELVDLKNNFQFILETLNKES